MLMNMIVNLAFIRSWRGVRAALRSRAMVRRIAAVVLAPAAVLIALTACGSNPNDSAAAGAAGQPVRVVASTNVYGDIAQQIGGDQVQVTSIISDPSQDPHSYEASPQNQLALSKARVIIENGGGYDDFVTGWAPDEHSRQVWGRPACLLVLGDGSLLISDDGAGKVWRVTYGR